jgi:hypothetical protein
VEAEVRTVRDTVGWLLLQEGRRRVFLSMRKRVI